MCEVLTLTDHLFMSGLFRCNQMATFNSSMPFIVCVCVCVCVCTNVYHFHFCRLREEEIGELTGTDEFREFYWKLKVLRTSNWCV